MKQALSSCRFPLEMLRDEAHDADAVRSLLGCLEHRNDAFPVIVLSDRFVLRK